MHRYTQERRNCCILEGEGKFWCLGVSLPMDRNLEKMLTICHFLARIVVFDSILSRDCHGPTVEKEAIPRFV